MHGADSVQDSASSPGPSRGLRLAGWLLIALHALVSLHTAWSKSVTHDELWHLPVGLVNLQTGQFDADNLNPPLTRMWAALPLWLAGLESDEDAQGPAVGLHFVESHPANFQLLYFRGRVFNAALSIATACLLGSWTRRMLGDWPAFVALLLYCTCPNIVAHASIVTPDAGLMLGFVATLYVACRWLEQPRWSAAVLLGVVLGLTQCTKFTAIILYPVLGLGWLLSLKRERAWSLTAQAAAAAALSVVILNAVYLFQGTGQKLADYHFASQSLRTAAGLLDAAKDLPVPLPRDYVEGLDAQRAIMEGAHPVFLDGEWSVTGYPSYYPKTLLYKLPHLAQGLMLLGGFLWLLRPRGAAPWSTRVLLVAPVVLLLLIAGGTAMQLGVRYVLPVLPLLMLWGARAGVGLGNLPPAFRTVVAAVLMAGGLASLRFHPHHLAYFNEHAGGPVGGRQHLLDSNLDWGQDLNLVKPFMDEHDLNTIGLAYFGTVPPELVGIDYTLPPGRTPETAATWSLPPGWYAVSVNYVMGRPHVIHQPDGGSHGVGLDEFGYFREHQPVARLGYSIDVYHIDEAP
jgi:hypothetical protein